MSDGWWRIKVRQRRWVQNCDWKSTPVKCVDEPALGRAGPPVQDLWLFADCKGGRFATSKNLDRSDAWDQDVFYRDGASAGEPKFQTVAGNPFMRWAKLCPAEAEEKLDEVRWKTSPYSSGQIRKKYQSLVEAAMVFKFPRDGKTLTDFRKFTLHSLRSTHITHQLLNGVRIRLIADNVGNSEAEIERTYCRLNNLLNVGEIGMHRQVVKPEDELNIV